MAGVEKLINHASATNLLNQQMLKEHLDDLFDVAHWDVMTIMKFDEDRKFLEAQPKEGRRDTINISFHHCLFTQTKML